MSKFLYSFFAEYPTQRSVSVGYGCGKVELVTLNPPLYIYLGSNCILYSQFSQITNKPNNFSSSPYQLPTTKSQIPNLTPHGKGKSPSFPSPLCPVHSSSCSSPNQQQLHQVFLQHNPIPITLC